MCVGGVVLVTQACKQRGQARGKVIGSARVAGQLDDAGVKLAGQWGNAGVKDSEAIWLG